ncbi:MAG: SusC/RagA family TonB-linked outer membrane protein [Cyclobacteriaceae bacterium]
MKKIYCNWMKFLRSISAIGLMTLVVLGASAQAVITGRVTEEGSTFGLPGVNVLIKGTAMGAVTDIEGNYRVEANEGDVLVFSFVGYQDQERTVDASGVIDVQLGIDIEQLEEVVVVGYGTQEAKDVTGVVATVSTKEFNKGSIASPENLITGKVAGVSITPSTEPGGGASINIRGITSLNGGSSPLIVVDGVTLDGSGYVGGRNGLNFINPNDIETITILKDASAAAIYGTRAAAGVILVTTKSGKSGESSVVYDGFYSFSRFQGDFDFLSPSNFRLIVEDKAPQYLGRLGAENTSWIDEVIQPVAGHSHNVSFSGGGEKNTFNMSINRMVNNGIVKYSQNEITRLNVKTTAKLLDDNLKVTFQTINAFTKDNFSSNVTGSALSFDPTRPIYDDENRAYGGFWEWQVGLAPSNPVSTLEQTTNLGETRRSFSAINMTYNLPFLQDLSINTIMSADLRDGKQQFFQPTTYLTGLSHLGFINVGAGKGYTYNYEQFVNYKTYLESINGTFEAMVGYSYQDVFREYYGFFGDDLSTNNFTYFNPDVIQNLKPAKISPTRNQLQSVYGRLNFSYADKYLFTSNFRYDGSTKFGAGNRYGFFPSMALGWRISDEAFMNILSSTFSNLKLRVGYGQLGNQNIQDYIYETFYGLGTNDARYQFGGDYYNTLRPVAVDPNIKWETTTSTNIGLDFGLAKGKISGTLDFYNKVTSDLLTQVAPPAFTNVGDVVVTNVAELKNQGVELGLSIVAVDQSDFDWDIGFNAAYNQNEITKLTFGEDDGPGLPVGGISGDVGQTIQVWKVGEPVNSFRTYVRDESGISLSGETYKDAVTIDSDGDGVPDMADGQINEQDLVIDKSPNPGVILGLTSGMSYKNLRLDMTMRSNIGNYVYNNVSSANGFYDVIATGQVYNNIHESVLQTGYNTRQLHSDFYVENASFLRMDNITLSYNYTGLDFVQGRIYGTVQNAFTISGYSGPNPEISSGIDNNLYPMSTTYILGINLTF